LRCGVGDAEHGLERGGSGDGDPCDEGFDQGFGLVVAALGDHVAVVVGDVAEGSGVGRDGPSSRSAVFVATGAALFPGSVAGTGTKLWINSVLHVNSRLVPARWAPSARSRPEIPRRCFRPTGMTNCGKL
jgi:hypothetical protein